MRHHHPMDDPEFAQQRRWFDSWMVTVKSRLRQGASTVTHSLLLTALVVVVVGVVLFWLARPSGTDCIVRLEFAGSADTFAGILTDCGVESAAVVASLGHDLWFIAGYAIGLWLVCMIGARAFVTGATSRAFVVAAWCAVVAGVFDLAEDALLSHGIDGLLTLHKRPPAPGWTFMWAQGMALAKFVALLPALAVSLLVVVIVLGRLIVAVPLAVRAWRMLPKPSFTQFIQQLPALRRADPARFFRAWTASAHRIAQRKVQVVDRGSASAVAAAWKENYRLPAGHRPETGDVTGVCLSGGGIRAATFSLGAVQSLAAAGILERAKFLSTVSGGGYFGAAYQNLRYLSDQHGAPLSTNSAFAKGTAEEDHLRRHGKYIADGTIQWVRALFVVLRNTAMSLGIVYACLVLGAWGAAYAYSVPEEWATELFPGPHRPVTVGAWAWIAIVVPLALALLTWAISGFGRFTRRSRLEKTAALLAGLAITVAVVGVVIPVLTSFVVDQAFAFDPENSLRIGTFAAILGTATTVWNTLSKHRPESKSGSDSAPTIWSRASKTLSKAAFAIRFLLTLAVVFGALALALVVFLAELHNAMVDVGAGGMHWLPIAAGVVLLLLFGLFDQTRMSLHPFYKARLASAFDVQLESGVATQPEYKHLSTLSDYGRPIGDDGKASADPNGGLRLVLCAAAHVSGPSLAPPGRRVVPFVFSSDFIGSPKLGYFPTKSLEDALTSKTYRSDVTLLAASAISGAAFASAMGRASGPLDLLLALSNARLGAWLPNPRYHGLRNRKPELLPDQDRHRTPLPTIRRLGYFAREVFGVYPANDRFVYVTDGGHYENLGLVELLRRRCKTIYCVDASGDHSLAYTLAEAAALAYEELGVTITIDGLKLAAMSAEEGKEPNADLRSLHERLSKQSVVRGTFSYPPEAGGPSEGTLIVGKATLGQDLADQPEMFPLKSYAATQEGFPGDTTADQWFEVDQFQGYVALGRLVGQRMSEI